jgi:hypothetical protein
LARQIPQQQQQQQLLLTEQLPQPITPNVTVVAPTRGMWGTASIGGSSIYLSLSSSGEFHKVRWRHEYTAALGHLAMKFMIKVFVDLQQWQQEPVVTFGHWRELAGAILAEAY